MAGDLPINDAKLAIVQGEIGSLTMGEEKCAQPFLTSVQDMRVPAKSLFPASITRRMRRISSTPSFITPIVLGCKVRSYRDAKTQVNEKFRGTTWR